MSRAGERWSFAAIGVGWHIDAPEPLTAGVRDAIAARIEAYDRTWSRFREDSLVARIGREPGNWPLPAEAGPLLALYRVLYEATGGRMSPVVRGGTAAPPWRDTIAWTPDAAGAPPAPAGVLAAPRPVVLDVAAAGKGQLADLVSGVLTEHGVGVHTVDASGDIRRRGPATRVALEHPLDETLAVGVVELAEGAIAASGQNRQPGHLVDALTGLPVRAWLAGWATASSALVADGAATAIMLTADADAVATALRPEWGRVEWARMDARGRLEVSAGFEGELFA